MTLGELRDRHRRIGLDSNLFIYLFFEAAPLGLRVRAIIDMIESGAFEGVLATIGLTEILAGPARSRDAAVFEAYASELRALPNLRIQSLDELAAEDAAWLRGEDVGISDAVHLACARRAGATAFITNDRRLRSRPGLEVIQLAELEAT